MTSAANGDGGRSESDRRWRLSPTVAIRPEPFGAIAYDFSTRRLAVLRSPVLVRLIESLDGQCLQDAMTRLEVAPAEAARLRPALDKLIRDRILLEETA